MKETIIDFLGIIITVIVIAIILAYLFNLIGRAQVYTDKMKRERLEICLDKNNTFQDCYHGIYDNYADFKGKNN